MLTAIALTRQPEAYEFLLSEIADGSRPARAALENAAPPAEVVERLSALS